jgi:phage regulator Rha-like protein
MSELVFIQKNECFTDSKKISEASGIFHKSIRGTIRKNINDLEEFGNLVSETILAETKSKRGRLEGRPEEIYALNEQQATFLITLLPNTRPVKKFKRTLVKEFYKMRKIIQKQKTIEFKQLKIEHSAGKPATIREKVLTKFKDYFREFWPKITKN